MDFSSSVRKAVSWRNFSSTVVGTITTFCLPLLPGLIRRPTSDFAWKAVFFALLVAFEQFVDGADVSARRALHGGHALKHVQIVPIVKVTSGCTFGRAGVYAGRFV